MTSVAQTAGNLSLWRRAWSWLAGAIQDYNTATALKRSAEAALQVVETPPQAPADQSADQQNASPNPSKSVRPAGSSKTGRATPLNGRQKLSDDTVLRECLALVASQTVAVIGGSTGINPDSLIQPFVEPDDKRMANRVLAKAVARKLASDEFPEVVLGIGMNGGLFAFQVTEALIERGCAAGFLGLKPNQRAGADGYHFACSEADIRKKLGGRRVALVLPIVTDAHLPIINAIKTLVEREGCGATFWGAGTIIQYRPGGKTKLPRVDSLIQIGVTV